MSEYIEREAAIKEFETAGSTFVYGVACAAIISRIKAVPAADVRPVVRGEWLETDAAPHRIYCSRCYKTYVPNKEWVAWKEEYLPRNFCPNCGADMRKVHDGRTDRY